MIPFVNLAEIQAYLIARFLVSDLDENRSEANAADDEANGSEVEIPQSRKRKEQDMESLLIGRSVISRHLHVFCFTVVHK